MSTIPMGTSYAIWTGIGTAGGAIVGMIFIMNLNTLCVSFYFINSNFGNRIKTSPVICKIFNLYTFSSFIILKENYTLRSEFNGKVYIAGAIPEVGLNLLKEHFEVEMYEGEGIIDKETLKEGVKDASALISILSTNVDQEVIDSGKTLKSSLTTVQVSIM